MRDACVPNGSGTPGVVNASCSSEFGWKAASWPAGAVAGANRRTQGPGLPGQHREGSVVAVAPGVGTDLRRAGRSLRVQHHAHPVGELFEFVDLRPTPLDT